MTAKLDHEGCPAKKTETMWPLHQEGKETNQRVVEQFSNFLFRAE